MITRWNVSASILVAYSRPHIFSSSQSYVRVEWIILKRRSFALLREYIEKERAPALKTFASFSVCV